MTSVSPCGLNATASEFMNPWGDRTAWMDGAPPPGGSSHTYTVPLASLTASILPFALNDSDRIPESWWSMRMASLRWVATSHR